MNNCYNQFLSMNGVRARVALLGLMLMAFAATTRADPINVPNFSFESQPTPFATSEIDSWQETPQPAGYGGEFGDWTNLVGTFFNYPSTNGTFIDNADANQIGFLFSNPGVGIFQDFNSTDWSNGAPTHLFNATYKPGKVYTLTVGLTSSTVETLAQGATLQLSLYYRDNSSNIVTVAATTVTYDTNVFTNLTHLIDFQVKTPIIGQTDAWTGRNVGIEILCTTPPAKLGGVWDLDNVRLVETLGVPNFSFESQPVEFVGSEIDAWQQSPQPANYGGELGPWTNLSGNFFNYPAPGVFVAGADGNQLAYVFADAQVGLFQDYNSTDWSNGAPTHAFNAIYQPGKSYVLTVGLTSSSQEPLTPGSTILLSLYYRDAASNLVTIAATSVTYDTNVFTNIEQLLDFQVMSPTVQPSDAWAGKNIGIQIIATTAPQFIGGVWDVDNVRLLEKTLLPNYSFESQPTPFADPRVDSWAKPPPPAGFDPNTFGDWFNLAGVFQNAPPTNADYIDNADGNQLAYLFAYPQAALFQDNNTTDWTGATPNHAFDLTFKPGKTYSMTVGVTSSREEQLVPGATLELSLYYRDASNNAVTVAASDVVYNTNVFANITHLLDFHVTTREVKATDPWVGKHVGVKIQVLSTPIPSGVWDLDNVRLSEMVATTLKGSAKTANGFGFTLQSEPSRAFQIQAAASANAPAGSWSTLTTVTNLTGNYLFVDPATNQSQRFYRAHQLP